MHFYKHNLKRALTRTRSFLLNPFGRVLPQYLKYFCSKVCHADELFQMFKTNAFPFDTAQTNQEKKVKRAPR